MISDQSVELIEKYINRMKTIQCEFCELFIDECDKETKYKSFIHHFDELKIQDNYYEFRSFLHILSQIYQTQHHQPNNLKIIEDFLLYYKNGIQSHFKNSEIFNIFQNDKKILIFLYKWQILNFDQFVLNKLEDNKYSTFFFLEVKDMLDDEKFKEISNTIPDDFEEKRQKGDNDLIICEIIRNDSIGEFKTYINEKDINLSSKIDTSIFETNPFLIDKPPTLIEYAALYGSIQIFQYLLSNNELSTNSIWDYAILGQNKEIITILEDNHIEPNEESIKNCFIESIKCHNKNISSYFQEKYLHNIDINSSDFITHYFDYHNFDYISTNFINKSFFNDLIIFDYPFIVDIMMKYENIDVNNKTNQKTNLTLIENNEINVNFQASPLYYAVSNNNIEITKLLLSNPNINAKEKIKFKYTLPFSFDDKISNHAIFAAVITLFVLSFFLPVRLLFISCFLCIIAYILRVFEIILKIPSSIYWMFIISMKSINKFCISIKEFSILHLAVLENNAEMVKLLLSSNKIDINEFHTKFVGKVTKQTALHIAIKQNNVEIVKLLLSNPQININAIFKSFLSRPVHMNFLWIILIPLSNSYLLFPILAYFLFDYPILANIQSNIKVIIPLVLLFRVITKIRLFAFCSIIIYEVIEFLASLTYLTLEEYTALYMAISFNYIEIAKLLISNDNINVNYICKYKGPKMLDNLVTNKYKAFEEKEITALYLATQKSNIEIVKLLLSKNKIDIKTKCKITNYYKNINENRPFIICLIFDAIDRLTKNKTALQVAVETANLDFLKLF